MTLAEQIIAAFGGLTNTAKALRHKHVSTVDGWKRSGKIPRWRRAEIISAAQEKGIELPPGFADEEKAA